MFHNSSRPGEIVCPEKQPCSNITFDNVQINGFVHNEWGKCENVASSTFTDVLPAGLGELCAKTKSTTPDTPIDDDDNGKNGENKVLVFVWTICLVAIIGLLYCFKDAIRIAWNNICRYCCGSKTSTVSTEPLLESIIFETTDANTVMV